MRKTYAWHSLAAIITIWLCISNSLLAQGNLGGLTGAVSDASGAGVPDVVIKVINTATNKVSQVMAAQRGT
jgi:hypothetical protein